jgi:hypothetical protein
MWSCALLARLLGTAPPCALFLYSLAGQQNSDSRNPTLEKGKGVDDINVTIAMSQDDPDAPLQLIIPVFLALFLISTIPPPAAPEFLSYIVGLHLLSLTPLLLAQLNLETFKTPTLSLYQAPQSVRCHNRNIGTWGGVRSSVLFGERAGRVYRTCVSGLRSH